MKHLFCKTTALWTLGLFALSLLFSSCFVPLVAADIQIQQAKAATKFEPDQIGALRATTTHFVLTDADWKQRAAFEAAIRANWTYTPIDVVAWDEAKALASEAGHSFFWIEGQNTEVYSQPSDGSRGYFYTTTYLYRTLLIPKFTQAKKKRVKDESLRFGRIELCPTMKTMLLGSSVMALEKEPDTLYKVGEYYNSSPAMTGLYLCEAQRNLNQDFARSRFAGLRDDKELARLAQEVLYVPETIFLINSNRFGRRMTDKQIQAILKKYPYRTQIVSQEELTALVSDPNRQVYVLDYVRSSSDKFVSIYKSRHGLVYHRYTPLSYKLKSKDLKAIFSKK